MFAWVYDLIVYKDKKRQWRWRLKATNGKIIADSGQGYRRRIDCLRTAQDILDGQLRYEVIEGEE